MMKKKARGGDSRGDTPRKVFVDRDGLATSFVSPSNEFVNKWKKKPAPPFSLNDEARRTQSRYTSQLDSKLRFSQVAFVSAGNSSGEDPKESNDVNKTTIEVSEQAHTPSAAPPEGRMANLALGQSPNVPQKGRGSGSVGGTARPGTTTPTDEPLATNGNSLFYVDLHGSKTSAQARTQSSRAKPSAPDVEGLFYVDLQGSKELARTTLPKPVIGRSPSPTSSSSSGEVILFSGRDSVRGKKRDSDHLGRSTALKSTLRIFDDPIRSNTNGRPTASNKLESITKQLSTVSNNDNAMIPKPVGPPSPSEIKLSNSTSKAKPAKISGKRRWSYAKKNKAQNDALLADYIANMDAEDLKDGAGEATLSARPLDTMDTSGWEDEPGESDEKRPDESVTSYSETWESADLQDFDDLSTSDEVLAEVKRVLAKRQRSSGVHYLIVCGGYSVDDARWIHMDSLNTTVARQRIQLFEAQQTEMVQVYAESAYSMDSDEEAQIAKDVERDMEDILDEQDLFDRNVGRMEDEEIARLLSKQEQLGLGSDEIMLFDSISTSSGARGWKKARKRPSGDFPSASLLADVLDQDPYDGFDIMDMDRPSLKKKGKGRRGTLPMEISDSELEQSLQAAWTNDRSKKKQRKQEREELRAQGLLGKKGKVDMKAKYSQGMAMTQVLDEVKGFLASTDENLSLPPMGQRERKLVHELASTFGLKSKSIGDGVNRFPTLIRTKRTIPYDESLLPKRITRGFGLFLPRLDKSKKRGAPVTKVGRGGGFSKAAVSYRDGDVVGAFAPELGQENRGRSMLEKMGWSTGTALGAVNNKGIMLPVTHVVKNSKAGLG